MLPVERFYHEIRGRHLAVCGLGRNNLPVCLQLLAHGAKVTACDKRTRQELGETADILENAGAVLHLGEGYLADLDVDMILRTPGMKPYLPEFEQARARGVQVTSEMELFLAYCPAPVYGITGSDGKTTTSTITAGMLEASGRRVHLGGNIGRPLLPILGEIAPEDAVVVELSSFQLTRMTQSPAVGIITNLAPNHLDWHTDMAEYIEAKRNLLAHQQPAERAVLNADNALTASLAEELPSQVWTFSRRGAVKRGTWMDADGVLWGCDGVNAPVRIMNSREICLPGLHNVENYLGAFAMLWGTVSPQTMADYARRFSGVAHRCELVRERNGVRWYNDSIGTSPSRTMAGLRAFDRKVILIAGGYDKHIPYAPLGPVAAETVKAAILMGATANAIEAAIRACADLPILRVQSMEEAVWQAEQLAKEGDIVFMSPASASFDLYKNFEERGEHFRRLVNALDENIDGKDVRG